MTVGEFIRRLQAKYDVRIFRDYRDSEWAVIGPPGGDDDLLDDAIARQVCRKFGIPPSSVGL